MDDNKQTAMMFLRQMESLQQDVDTAASEENYDKAAELDDQLADLRKLFEGCGIDEDEARQRLAVELAE